MPICPIPKINAAISINTTFPYIPNIKNAITGRVAPARGMPSVHLCILKSENTNEQQQVNTSPNLSKNSKILFSFIGVYPCGFLFDHIILGINNINKKSNPIYENPKFPNILFSTIYYTILP